MRNNSFLRISLSIMITIIVLLSISIVAFATEQVTQPADTPTGVVATSELVDNTDITGNTDNNANKEKGEDEKDAVTVAYIGLFGVVVVAIIGLIGQVLVSRLSIKHSNIQSNKELSAKLEQIRNEQGRYANEKKEAAIKMQMAKDDFEHANVRKRYESYTRILFPELKRIEALSNPEKASERSDLNLYSHISSRLSSMDFDCKLHESVSYNIGELLMYIDGFNRDIDNMSKMSHYDGLEKKLEKINKTAKKIEKEIETLCDKDVKNMVEYYNSSAAKLLEIAKQLEPPQDD